jgi:RNA recognition motif-containing protein
LNGYSTDKSHKYPEYASAYIPTYIPPVNTTVYVGNLSSNTTGTLFMTIEEQIKTLFENYGPIHDIKLQTEKGFGFIKYLNFNIE